jgi:cation-transporting P-type ATPase 13A2
MASVSERPQVDRFVYSVLTGAGRNITSSDLVPGDVYEVSDPSLSQFPADSLLLSGDCIVNESMLTGK